MKIKAARERTSLAQLIRDAVQTAYGIGESEGVDPRKDPFYRRIGGVASGRADGSVHHDRDIYGVEP